MKMNDKSKAFLEKYLPDALKAEELNDALDSLYDLIDEKGFAPPYYEEYNDFGREAQRIYDDLYLSNGQQRCGVEIADIVDALQNPIKSGPVRVMKNGDTRQILYGRNASVTVSVRNKRLIQVNPRMGTAFKKAAERKPSNE